MSTQVSEPQSTSPLADVVQDNSRAVDVEAITAAKGEGSKLVKSAVQAFGRFRGIAKSIAVWDLGVRSMILNSQGIPDWNAQKSTQTYAVLVGDVIRDALANADRDVAASIRANVRKATERERPSFVVRWIAEHDGSKLKAEEVAAIMAGDESLAKVLGDPSQALKREVQRHYKLTGLTSLPDAFKATGETAPVVPGPDSPPSEVLQAMNAGASAVESGALAPSTAGEQLTVLHRSATALAGTLFDNAGKLGEIENRPAAINTAERLSELFGIIGRVLAGENTPEDLEKGRGLFYAKSAK